MSEAENPAAAPSRPKYKLPAGTSAAPKPVFPTGSIPEFGSSFDSPKLEIPPVFREMAERSVAQAKETYDKMKSAAEQATDLLEDSYTTASKGISDYGLKVIEAARVNTNSAFDFASQLMTAKSLAEVVELSSAHTRNQYEALTAQTKELATIAQKTAAATAEPVRESFSKMFKAA
jgi:phasin